MLANGCSPGPPRVSECQTGLSTSIAKPPSRPNVKTWQVGHPDRPVCISVHPLIRTADVMLAIGGEINHRPPELRLQTRSFSLVPLRRSGRSLTVQKLQLAVPLSHTNENEDVLSCAPARALFFFFFFFGGILCRNCSFPMSELHLCISSSFSL
jgi:hypothetical protein